jgi:hypothetical protein
MTIVNGGAPSAKRISSGTISLNGITVVKPNQFNNNVAKIVVPVNLVANNSITVDLRSAPSGQIFIWISPQ